MKDLRFKKLDETNWLEPDKAMQSFGHIDNNGNLQSLGSSDWLEQIFAPRLDDNIPEDIHILFETARGAMIYGYFFYPIFSFSSEQFTRIAETAINKKCEEVGTPKTVQGFRKKIRWLVNNTFISKESAGKWQRIVFLRNHYSHPTFQNIVFPSMAIDLMTEVAGSINELFA